MAKKEQDIIEESKQEKTSSSTKKEEQKKSSPAATKKETVKKEEKKKEEPKEKIAAKKESKKEKEEKKTAKKEKKASEKKEKTEKKASKKTTKKSSVKKSPDNIENLPEIELPELEPAKKHKKNRSGLIAIFLIFVITALGLGGYWYIKIYQSEENDIILPLINTNKEKISFVKYETDNDLEVINNKYLIESKANKLYKILDLDGNVLFEGEIEFNLAIEGIDNNLYIILDEFGDTENLVTIYRLENNQLNKIKDLSKVGYTLSKTIYQKDDKEYLLGYIGTSLDNSELTSYITESIFINLESNEISLGETKDFGEVIRTSTDQPIITNSEDSVVAKKGNKYGVISLKDGKPIIDFNYDGLYSSIPGTLIAIKDNKAGIIDYTLKKKVDFKYDFIAYNKDHFVVGLNNKLAIMNSDYNLVTDFVFDYQDGGSNITYHYQLCCGVFNTFTSVRKGDRYILVTNFQENRELVTYAKHEAYIINKDGTYELVPENAFGFIGNTNKIYTYNDITGNYTFYDEELNKKFDLNFQEYDFNKSINFEIYGDTLVVENKIFYDYTTGDAMSKRKDQEYGVGHAILDYDGNTGIITVISNSKKVGSYKYTNPYYYSKLYLTKDNGEFYSITKDGFYTLKVEK